MDAVKSFQFHNVKCSVKVIEQSQVWKCQSYLKVHLAFLKLFHQSICLLWLPLTFVLRSSLDFDTTLGEGVDLISSSMGEPTGVEEDLEAGDEEVLAKNESRPSFMSSDSPSASCKS